MKAGKDGEVVPRSSRNCGEDLALVHHLGFGFHADLSLARGSVPDVEQLAELLLPDDSNPACDAVVSVGHPFSYLPDEASIDRAAAEHKRMRRELFANPD
jgi:hypothetical protein